MVLKHLWDAMASSNVSLPAAINAVSGRKMIRAINSIII